LPEPLFVCNGLSKTYVTPSGGIEALHAVDASFTVGEITAVVGPSGSGKSTLLRALAGLDRPSDGSLRANGEELSHAQRFARRIKELYGVVPGSLEFAAEQRGLQPPERQTDVVHVIRGVIEAETAAIEHYSAIIEATDGVDWVTQDMVIEILHDEEGHRRLFEGFLREYEAEGRA